MALTDAELEALRLQALQDASTGVRSISVDGTSTTIDHNAAMKAIEAEEQRRVARTRSPLAWNLTKVISRGLQ